MTSIAAGMWKITKNKDFKLYKLFVRGEKNTLTVSKF